MLPLSPSRRIGCLIQVNDPKMQGAPAGARPWRSAFKERAGSRDRGKIVVAPLECNVGVSDPLCRHAGWTRIGTRCDVQFRQSSSR
jgi:hypothetical protein